MKAISLLGLFLFAGTSFASGLTEVSIGNIFIPPEGYDSNDKIEIVIDGQLPNTCFEIDHFEVQGPVAQEFTIKAFARKRGLTECTIDLNTGTLPQFPVAYTETYTLGQLSAGTYVIKFGNAMVRFGIDHTAGQNVDEHLYAPVSNAFIPELVYETENAQVILTGILPNRCTTLSSDDIEVKKYEHVLVILPKLKVSTNSECPFDPRPLEAFVDLGAVTAGRYLIHIRSMTGGSVNKVFTVIKRSENGGPWSRRD